MYRSSESHSNAFLDAFSSTWLPGIFPPFFRKQHLRLTLHARYLIRAPVLSRPVAAILVLP